MIRRLLAVALLAAVVLVGLRALRGPSPDALLGLWEVGSPQKIGDPVRFYYFHKGGKGVYRYGQIGLNQTRSFDWSVSGDVLTLHFRKSGETARSKFAIEARDGGAELVLADDPRNGGGARYRRRPAQLDAEEGPLDLDGHGLERMWIDHAKFATGGQGFTMYQLSKHALPGGRKLGWFHAGDFDDWTTETLAYRMMPAALTLDFLLRGESATTVMRIAEDSRRRTPVMTLETDPRDFGARHRYVDGGPSF